MTDQGQIVPANHADSLSLTRPDGTTVQIPAVYVLSLDAVLRRCLGSRERLFVHGHSLDGCWHASLESGWGPDREAVESEPSGTPWAAMVSLAGKLWHREEATP